MINFIKLLKDNSKILFFYTLLILLIFQIFNMPYNVYSIKQRDLEQRLERAYGYCDKDGYGFVKYIFDKYEIKDKFPIYYNLDISPGIYGIFQEYKNDLDEDKIIIINFKENLKEEIYHQKIMNNDKKINLKQYSLLERNGNCYFFSK